MSSVGARFDFSAPGRILFGPGAVAEAGAAARALCDKAAKEPRALVVSGGDPKRLEPLLASLQASGVEAIPFALRREPRFEDARSALELARGSHCSMAIGMGGGSALDLAKAVAALLANPGDPLDYAEVIGGGKPLSESSFACIAIPTTAGTGSEATRNAVLTSGDKGVKVSLRSPTMLPSLALIDPELSLGIPPRITADTGLDALTQLIEPLTCSSASGGPNPLVDAICREGIRRAVAALPRAFAEGQDREARSDMAFASLSGGLALANARLGAVHGLAGPLGGAFPVPHGAACAALLAPVVCANAAALLKRNPEHHALSRYSEIASVLNGGHAAGPEDAGILLHGFTHALGVRKLREFGLKNSDFPKLVQKALVSSSMRGNPIALTPEEFLEILEAAL
jgi:alcohol dehydrogenase class IV